MIIKKEINVGAGSTTVPSISTLLTVDGKTGWQFVGASVQVLVPYQAAAFEMNVQVNTEGSIQAYDDPDLIFDVTFKQSSTTGYLGEFQPLPHKVSDLWFPRITVQPTVYIVCAATGTAATAKVKILLAYDLVKLTDLEVMRLLQGGV